MNLYQVVRRPIVTEKGLTKKEDENTLTFEVHPEANKVQVRQAIEKIFKVLKLFQRLFTYCSPEDRHLLPFHFF